MPVHDAYARKTPFEIALPGPEFADERFGAIVEEAETQGLPGHLTDPNAFALLGEVGRILQEIRAPDDLPRLIDQYGLLLFQAFTFWRAGCPLFLVSEDAARRATGGSGSVPIVLADFGSAYVQLPQHLFWVLGEAESQPESLDGFFLTWSDAVLSTLAVAGVRSDRTGVSTLPLPSVPIEDLPAIAMEQIREDGEDFESTIPGGELDRLYGIRSVGELLKLVARLLPSLAGASDAEREQAPPEGRPEGSRLPFRRIRASGNEEGSA
jgi:hypothetical protein